MRAPRRLPISSSVLPIACLATALWVAAACAHDPVPAGVDQPACNGAKCDGPLDEGSLVLTQNADVRLLNGYLPLFDTSTAPCVAPDPRGAAGPAVLVGSPEGTLNVVLVTTREQMARELGLDLGLKFKYDPVSADASLSLLRKTSTNSRTLNLLVKVVRSYGVRNAQRLVLSDAGRGLLAQDMKAFVNACGTSYANAVRFGGYLYALVTYQAVDEQTANELKANLGFSVGLPTLTLSPTLAGRMSTAATVQGVTATVQIVSAGFEFSGNVASSSMVGEFIGNGVTPEFFTKLDVLQTALEASIRTDACRDAGEGVCGTASETPSSGRTPSTPGIPSPGYARNTRRSAKATAVEIGLYERLPNTTVEGRNPFEQVSTQTDLIERYLRDFGKLQERMEAVYQNEVLLFQTATPSQQASYQVAAPATPLRRLEDLAALNRQWADEFRPPSDVEDAGAAMQAVLDAAAECWDHASYDLWYDCYATDPPVPRGSDTAMWKAGDAKLAAYAQTGRILPLRYKVGPATTASQLTTTCQQLGSAGVVYRAPTQDEAALLAPLVVFGPVTWPSTQYQSEIWISVPNARTACPGYFTTYPSYRMAATADEVACRSGSTQLTAVCVSTAGPLPSLVPP